MLYCHDRQNCCATSPACTCSKRWDDGEILDLSKTSPTDSELIKRAQQDPQEFGAIYERHVQNIYNYVYYRTGNEVDAEDLTARNVHGYFAQCLARDSGALIEHSRGSDGEIRFAVLFPAATDC